MATEKEKAPLPSDSSPKAELEKKEGPVAFHETVLNETNFFIKNGKVDYDPFKIFPSPVVPLYGHNSSLSEGSSDILSKIFDLSNDATPLPMAVRWISVGSGRIRALVELPPQKRTILYNPMLKERSHNTKPQSISLPFPWVQLGITIQFSRGGEDNKKIIPISASIDSYFFTETSIGPRFRSDKNLYHPCLPNLFPNTSMCFGFRFDRDAKSNETSIGKLLQYVINGLWGTTYNLNLVGSGKTAIKALSQKDQKTLANVRADRNRWSECSPHDLKVYELLFKKWSELSVREMVDLEGVGWPKLFTEEEAYNLTNIDGYGRSDHCAFSVSSPMVNSKAKMRSNPSVASKNNKLVKLHPSELKRIKPIADTLHKLDTLNQVLNVGHGGTAQTGLTRGYVKLSEEGVQEYKGVVLFGGPTATATRTLGPEFKISQQKSKRQGKVPRNRITTPAPPETYGLTVKALDESMDLMLSKLDTGQHPLPPGLRHWDPIRQIIVFERPPGFRKLTYHPSEKAAAKKVNSKAKTIYNIWVPWTQYWVNYNSKMVLSALWVTTSSKSMSHKDVKLGLLPLPNVYYDSRICTPNNLNKANDLTELISVAYNSVWNSNYNMDLLDSVRHFVGYATDYAPKTSPELRKAFGKITRGGKSGHLEIEFLEWWSRPQNPYTLIDLIPCIPPVSGYSSTDHLDVPECGCDIDDCGCELVYENDHPGRLMTVEYMMTHVRAYCQMSWMYAAYAHPNSTGDTTYDKILKHGQAYQSKALY